jgi:4-amino-4-deoxy-L-arabinose transferase-like glycosyltransferase
LGAEGENTLNKPQPTSTLTLSPKVELLILAAIVAVGAWLRFQHLELLEFKGDEAFAANRALEFVRGGKLPTSGLMSSVGVSNPPLFIWLLIPMFFVTSSITGVCCLIASLGLAAVVATWWIGRKYYSPLTGLVAAALFATAPWAVIYSRKIWAQDFVPVFATATIWAVHALVLGKKPKAVFWVLCLPICVIQIHYSGFALAATVVAILILLRPKIDWRMAIAGVVLALALAVPYVMAQQKDGWAEWKRMSEERSASRWNQLPAGMTINPQSGYPFPRRPSEGWQHALAIMNTGEIEDVLGLSTSKELDPNQIWAGKGAGQNQYFDSSLTFGAWLPGLQRLAFLAALVWFGVVAAKSGKAVFRREVAADEESKRAWILVLWFVVPLAVYLVAGLWTYLSYYVILYPVFFLIFGALSPRAVPAKVLIASIAVFVAGNILFTQDVDAYLSRYGGAQGTYGSGLGFKQAAAQFVAKNFLVNWLVDQNRLLQMDHWQRAEPAQLDLPFLAAFSPEQYDRNSLPPVVVLVVDDNRTSFDAARANFGGTRTNFGPMRVYVINRP